MSKRRRGPPILAIVLFAVSAVLWVIAITAIASILRKGYTYACIGSGCEFGETPEVAGELHRMAATLPFAILTMVGGILLLAFRRYRQRGSGPRMWDEVPLAGPRLPSTPPTVQPELRHLAAALGQTGPASVSGSPMAAGSSMERIGRLRISGIEGKARLSGLRDTGMAVGGNRLYELDLDVEVPGRAPYRVKHSSFVPVNEISRLARGGTFTVRVDPVDRDELIVEFEQPAPPGAAGSTPPPGPQLL